MTVAAVRSSLAQAGEYQITSCLSSCILGERGHPVCKGFAALCPLGCVFQQRYGSGGEPSLRTRQPSAYYFIGAVALEPLRARIPRPYNFGFIAFPYVTEVQLIALGFMIYRLLLRGVMRRALVLFVPRCNCPSISVLTSLDSFLSS